MQISLRPPPPDDLLAVQHNTVFQLVCKLFGNKECVFRFSVCMVLGLVINKVNIYALLFLQLRMAPNERKLVHQ